MAKEVSVICITFVLLSMVFVTSQAGMTGTRCAEATQKYLSCLNIGWESLEPNSALNIRRIKRCSRIEVALKNRCDMIVTSIDGVWSDWGEPSACSVTCGCDGIQSYTRECTPPQNGGAECVGDATKTEKCPIIGCPVDGVWSDWAEPSACSVTCGDGTLSYTRECTPPQNGGADCEGHAIHIEDCPVVECPVSVDGVWSDWGEPSECSVTCGDGTISYTRECIPPQHGGADCEGVAIHHENCPRIECPIDGVWSDWGEPSECSVTCGDGTKYYTRSCSPPQHGGAVCEGDAAKVEDCSVIECPVDGVWSDWGEPSACSETCGEGILSYKRVCSPLEHGGADCEGDATKVEDCLIIGCPVDGVWSDWGKPSACSVTCGDGTISYTRECIPPQNGGADCEGDATHIQECPMIECPVDGVWGDWGEPSACSVTCGDGTLSYKRKCTPPQHGGADCEGDATKTEDCPIIECPVDGVWSDWGEPSACSVTCGDGILSYTRECLPPQHGGADCEGDATHIQDCPMIECPVDGVWSDWGEQSECSVTCGDGTLSYTRECLPPQHGGADCEGDATHIQDCPIIECPVDGVWSDWGEPSACSVTCGDGTLSFKRECIPPQHGGADCEGHAIHILDCPLIECPVDGVWSDWGEPSACSETCGDGAWSYTRVCTPPQHGGADCEGDAAKVEDCSVVPCPVDGVWSEWGEPSECSVTCGEGTYSYTRECTPPQHGGSDCIGDAIEIQDCPIIECPVDGVWSDWGEPSECSESCGCDGILSYTRVCTPPQHGGADCVGYPIKIEDCPVTECPETSMPLTTLIFMRSMAKLVAQGKLSAIPYLDDFLDDPETAESAIAIMNGIIELAGTSNSRTHLHFRGHKLRQLCAFKPAEDQMCGLFRPYL